MPRDCRVGEGGDTARGRQLPVHDEYAVGVVLQRRGVRINELVVRETVPASAVDRSLDRKIVLLKPAALRRTVRTPVSPARSLHGVARACRSSACKSFALLRASAICCRPCTMLLSACCCPNDKVPRRRHPFHRYLERPVELSVSLPATRAGSATTSGCAWFRRAGGPGATTRRSRIRREHLGLSGPCPLASGSIPDVRRASRDFRRRSPSPQVRRDLRDLSIVLNTLSFGRPPTRWYSARIVSRLALSRPLRCGPGIASLRGPDAHQSAQPPSTGPGLQVLPLHDCLA